MQNKLIFSEQRKISSAFIDSSVRLGIAQSALLVQDNLTECFSMLKCDGVLYREQFNAFWVFTKTKIHFNRRPNWQEEVLAKTFPVDNQGLKTHINTVLKDSQGAELLTANQEACVLSLENHRPIKLSSTTYPQGPFPNAVFTAPFEKFPQDFSESDFVYEQKIRAQHIDMSNHMNNIEYIKLALNVFSNDFLLKNEPSELEVHYNGESKEGQTLRVFAKKSESDAKTTFINIKESERSVFEMKIQFY